MIGPTHHTSQAAAASLTFCYDPFQRSHFSAYLEVFNAIVDAGRQDLVLPAAPRLSDNLDDLLQGTAHSVEHGVFVDPG